MKQIVSLSKNKFALLVALLFSIGVFLTFHFGVMAWQTPGNNPPGGNTPAPINVGPNVNNVGQIKDGDIGAARFGSNQYCDASFQNCGIPGLGDRSIYICPYIDGTSTDQGDCGTTCVGQLGEAPTCVDYEQYRAGHNDRRCRPSTIYDCVHVSGPILPDVTGTWVDGNWSNWSEIDTGCSIFRERNRVVQCEFNGYPVSSIYCEGTRPNTYEAEWIRTGTGDCGR